MKRRRGVKFVAEIPVRPGERIREVTACGDILIAITSGSRTFAVNTLTGKVTEMNTAKETP